MKITTIQVTAMSPNVQAVVDQIKERIAELQHLTDRLIAFDCESAPPTDAPPPAKRSRRSQPRAPRQTTIPETTKRKLTVKDAMREVLASITGPVSSIGLRALVDQRYPHLAPRSSSIPVNLLDMVSGGEMNRTGTGRAAQYTVVKLKQTTAQAYEAFRKTIPAPATDNE